jgi:integrase
MEETLPMPKRPETLPLILSPNEVVEFLECIAQAKHRAILMSCYAAGLRVSEVVRLKPADIDTRRMVIRIEEGKGRRDRYVMLSTRLANALQKWQESGKPNQWLFPGNPPENPITRHAVEKACRVARRRLQDQQAGYATRVEACVRCSHARERSRHSYNSIALRPQQHSSDGQLSTLGDNASLFRNEPSGCVAAYDRIANSKLTQQEGMVAAPRVKVRQLRSCSSCTVASR